MARSTELRDIGSRMARQPLATLARRDVDEGLIWEALRTHDRAVELLIEQVLAPPAATDTTRWWIALGVVTIGTAIMLTGILVLLVYLLMLVGLLLLLSLYGAVT